jgi:HEPN domain-containing protein
MTPRQKEPSPDYVAEARRWLTYAEEDLVTAQSNHADARVPNRNAACMAQQAAEKAVKATILLEGQPFDMIHDVDVLANAVPADFEMPLSAEELSWLTDLETSARYPDEGEAITSEDAEKGIELAEKLVDAAKEHFSTRGATG